MIVPMKKVSLIVKGSKKQEALVELRRLGIVHIEINEGTGERLAELYEKISLLENAIFIISKKKKVVQKSLSTEEALSTAADIAALDEEKRRLWVERQTLLLELERLKGWGDFDPKIVDELTTKGYELLFFEVPKAEYEAISDGIKTVRLQTKKASVRFMLMKSGVDGEQELISALSEYRFALPELSVSMLEQKIAAVYNRIKEVEEQTALYACCCDGLKGAVESVAKEIEFEIYSTGMSSASICKDDSRENSVSYLQGYIEAENLTRLKQAAAKNSWGLLSEEPCVEDNVPTKLKNNKFVSLIYPLTDFLGTVPGYFEYDISAWFLVFILIFFGIIFGDGGYGLLLTAAAAVPICKSLINKKKISPVFLLMGLFGLSIILWGTFTCTWFGLSVEQIPVWIRNLSIPVISNVYADKIWYPFWTGGKAGLTTSQNLQIFCFSLALIQLTVAHIKGIIRNKESVKFLGDLGAILQLLGIYYVVLSLVVNASVFSFGLVIGGVGVGVGMVAIVLIATGFVLSFVFSNYEGSIIKSILTSLTNIVSVLLGVVNVFSDIVSYIRLWAVGLAGAAISATVNELAGPLLGNFMFMLLAVVLLVFGHGLNMILNVLSVIVHGIRLNTLEFSSHLDMSWSGHKFKPFKE